jgi:hypothetical protein
MRILRFRISVRIVALLVFGGYSQKILGQCLLDQKTRSTLEVADGRRCTGAKSPGGDGQVIGETGRVGLNLLPGLGADSPGKLVQSQFRIAAPVNEVVTVLAFALFQQKKIGAVWAVEPRVSRLENEAGGKALVEESDAATTVLVSSAKFLNEKRELASKFVEANRDLTDWISKNPAEAQKIVKADLLAETCSDMSAELIAHAWKRIIFTSEIPRALVQAFVANPQKAGFMKTAPDISRLFEMP